MAINRLLFLSLISGFVTKSGYSQILNGDFELWEDSLSYNPNHESSTWSIPLLWKHELDNPSDDIGYYRTTDAAKGNYLFKVFLDRKEEDNSINLPNKPGFYKLRVTDTRDQTSVHKVLKLQLH